MTHEEDGQFFLVRTLPAIHQGAVQNGLLQMLVDQREQPHQFCLVAVKIGKIFMLMLGNRRNADHGAQLFLCGFSFLGINFRSVLHFGGGLDGNGADLRHDQQHQKNA